MIARLATALLDVLIGEGCAACGVPGPPLCAPCAAGMSPVGPHWCGRCGHPWPAPHDACAQCVPGVWWARQATQYDDPVPRVVSALKDDRRRALARPLADLMLQRVPPPLPGSVLVPVPLAPRRQADRGFNQAQLIAQALSEGWGVPLCDVLERHDHGPAQRGSRARERRAQVQDAFRCTGRPPLQALLVDDVVTTGSTLAAAARALRAAGCARVGAVALARVAVAGGGSRVGGRQTRRGRQ